MCISGTVLLLSHIYSLSITFFWCGFFLFFISFCICDFDYCCTISLLLRSIFLVLQVFFSFFNSYNFPFQISSAARRYPRSTSLLNLLISNLNELDPKAPVLWLLIKGLATGQEGIQVPKDWQGIAKGGESIDSRKVIDKLRKDGVLLEVLNCADMKNNVDRLVLLGLLFEAIAKMSNMREVGEHENLVKIGVETLLSKLLHRIVAQKPVVYEKNLADFGDIGESSFLEFVASEGLPIDAVWLIFGKIGKTADFVWLAYLWDILSHGICSRDEKVSGRSKECFREFFDRAFPQFGDLVTFGISIYANAKWAHLEHGVLSALLTKLRIVDKSEIADESPENGFTQIQSKTKSPKKADKGSPDRTSATSHNTSSKLQALLLTCLANPDQSIRMLAIDCLREMESWRMGQELLQSEREIVADGTQLGVVWFILIDCLLFFMFCSRSICAFRCAIWDLEGFSINRHLVGVFLFQAI